VSEAKLQRLSPTLRLRILPYALEPWSMFVEPILCIYGIVYVSEPDLLGLSQARSLCARPCAFKRYPLHLGGQWWWQSSRCPHRPCPHRLLPALGCPGGSSGFLEDAGPLPHAALFFFPPSYWISGSRGFLCREDLVCGYFDLPLHVALLKK